MRYTTRHRLSLGTIECWSSIVTLSKYNYAERGSNRVLVFHSKPYLNITILSVEAIDCWSSIVTRI